MKKRINQVLAMLALAICVSSVYSCKDTSEDIYIENGFDAGYLENALKDKQKQIDDLLSQIKTLQDALANIKQCECDPAAILAQINTLLGRINELEESKANASDVEAINVIINQYKNEINNLQQSYRDLVLALQTDYVTKTELATTKQALEAELQSLRDALAAIKSCECDLTEILNRLNAAELAILDAKNTAQQALENAETAQRAADAAKAAADAAQSTADAAKKLAQDAYDLAQGNKTLIEQNKTAIENLTTYIENRFITISDSLKTAYDKASQAYTTAENNKELIEKLQAHDAEIDELIQNMQGQLNNIDGKVTTLTTNVETLQSTLEQVVSTMATKAEVEELIETQLATVKAELMGKIDAVDARVDAANARLDSVATALKNHDDEIEALKNRVLANEGNIADILDELDALRAEDARQAGLIDDLNEAITALQEKDQEISDSLASHLARIIYLEGKVTEIDQIANDLKDLTTQVNANTTKISEIEDAYKEADQKIMDALDDLREELMQELADLEKRVAKNEEDILDLFDITTALQETLAKMVTSITIQGTHNPAFGSLNLPTGAQTNMLIAYYGTANNDVYFPTFRTGNYVRPEEALTEKDMQMLGLSDDVLFAAGSTLLSNEEGNAGTIYLTVNPNTVDYTGLKLAIENSQAKNAGIALGKLKESDATLKFGWTRASGNAFYEAPATMTNPNAVQRINFNTAKIKDAVKEIYQNRRGADLGKIANDIYGVLSGLEIDRNAVKCQWEENGNEHAVYSEYNLAATAIKPLSLGFGKDFEVQTIPGYERANWLLDKLAGKVKSGIHVAFDKMNDAAIVKEIQSLKINKIELKDLSDDLLAKFVIDMDTIIVVDGLKYTLDFSDIDIINKNDNTQELEVPVMNGSTQVGTAKVPLSSVTIENITIDLGDDEHPGEKRIHFWLTKDLRDSVKELWGDIQDAMGGTNDMLGDLQKIVDDLNSNLNTINSYEDRLTNKVDQVTDKVKDYLERLNDKLAGLINSINSRVQPMMVASSSYGAKKLSGAKNYPTVFNSTEIDLMATTWTYELAVPICRKHVAVTNVFKGSASAQGGNADCLSALQSVNGADDMNTVVPGGQRWFNAKNLKKGYTYEVAYSALDFNGQIAVRKYYITIQ